MRAMPYSPTLRRLGAAYVRHGQRLPPLVVLLLVLLLGHLAARMVWSLMPLPDAAQWRAPAVGKIEAPAARYDLAALADAHLFGIYQTGPGDAANAPETRLSLSLLGILAGSDSGDSRALIGSSDGLEMPYAIGDDVTSGVSLQAIFPDRVVLSRGGLLETLRLNKDAPLTGASPAPASSVGNRTTEMLGRIREEVLTDPAKASQYIRVQPANVDGQLKGFRVYPGRDRAAFGEVGLRPGDLVTSINGIQLDDSQKALQMLSELSKAGSVTVTVDRGGQTQTLNMTFN